MKSIYLFPLLFSFIIATGQNNSTSTKQDHPFKVGSLSSNNKADTDNENTILYSKAINTKGKRANYVPSEYVMDIMQDHSGNIWFTSFNGIFRYDSKLAMNDCCNNRCNHDWRVQTDYLEHMKEVTKPFLVFKKEDGLIYNKSYSVLQDRSGNYWFGTVSGVSGYFGYGFGVPEILTANMDAKAAMKRYNGFEYQDTINLSYSIEEDGPFTNAVKDILEDNSGDLWFGTEHGLGLYSPKDKNGETYRNFTVDDGLSSNAINSLFEDKSGRIWVGTNNGVNYFDEKEKNKFKSKIRTEASIKKNTTISKNILSQKYFSVQNELPIKNIHSIKEDKSGRIWFATSDGVYCYDKNNSASKCVTNTCKHNLKLSGDLQQHQQEVLKSMIHLTNKDGLTSNNVTSLLIDKTGNIWFGFSDVNINKGGICKYNPKALAGRKFIYYSVKDGLGGNNVYSIFEDHTGNMWFGTSGGVSRLDPAGTTGKLFMNYGGGGC